MKKEENKTLDINDKDTVIEQLKKENYKLQCEVDALKKLRALVLQRNTQQIKKNRSNQGTKADISIINAFKCITDIKIYLFLQY